MKGVFEFEIGEPKKKVGFKYGTYAFSVACEKEGDIDLNTLFKRCGLPYISGKDEKGNDTLKADKPKLKSLLHLFYGAAAHYAEDYNAPSDFKVSTVSNWLDEIGEEKVRDMVNKAFLQHVPKN